MTPSPVPSLPFDELRRRAEDFLAQHHPAGTIPVPIDNIIEFKLHLTIIPVPSLCRGRGINGYLSADRTTIFVDQGHLEATQWPG